MPDAGRARNALVVDDNAANLRLTQAVLEDEEWNIWTAMDAEDALAAATAIAAPVDLVLLDVQMPGRSGIDVLPDLRARLPGVPIIALTAYAMPGDEDRFLKAGFSGYIAKPIDIACFVQQVEDIIAASGGGAREARV